jgi:hypothetical protein
VVFPGFAFSFRQLGWSHTTRSGRRAHPTNVCALADE